MKDPLYTLNNNADIISIDELFRPIRATGPEPVPAWSSMEALLDHFLPVAGPAEERSPVPDVIGVVQRVASTVISS